MNTFTKAATPVTTPASNEKDLLVNAYNALDNDRRAQLLSYAQYLVEQAQATTEQRSKALVFNQALAKAAAENQDVLFR